MNKWIEKSIELANANGYLDKLSKIYPVNLELERDITQEEKNKIKEELKSKNRKGLISVLLNLERFPIDDPYIGFLRKDKDAINKNPKTIKRIGDRLLEMGLDNLIIGASKAKSPSRQIGQLFKKYLGNLGYPILGKEDFLKSKNVAILEGGDKSLMDFAKEELGYTGKKGLDLIFKIRDSYIIGEAKFISAKGGTQDKSFREGVALAKRKSKKATHIAVLDGVSWLVVRTRGKKPTLYETVFKLKKNQIVISALLLKDFIKDFNKE